MVLKLFSSQSEHPLADPKEVKRIVADAVAGEAFSALREVADWVEALAADPEIKLDQRFSVLAQFDAAVQVHVRGQARDFVAGVRGAKGQRQNLWGQTRNLWKGLSAGYSACLEDAQREGRKDFLKRNLGWLALLLVRAHGQWLKWDRFRYSPPKPSLWEALGAAYLAAVEAGIDQRRIDDAPGMPATRIQDEYLRVVVFQASSMDELRLIEIEIAERLIATLVEHFTISAQAQPDSMYWIDPARPMMPMRLARAPQASASLRFLGTSRAVPVVQSLIETIDRDGLPAELDLGARYSPKAVLPVLRHLAQYWSARPPVRAHPRHAVRSASLALSGLAAIHDHLTIGGGNLLQWEIEDVSRGGFCLLATSGEEGGIRLGMLIGLQPAGGQNWLLGVVRRLARAGETQFRLGVETLSHCPVALQADVAGKRRLALLLDRLDAGAEVRLALPQFGFDECGAATLQHQGRFAQLEPKGLIESVDDCDVARYRVSQLSGQGR